MLGEILRRLPEDCTFDQGRFITSLGLSSIRDSDIPEVPILDILDDATLHQAFPRFGGMNTSQVFYSVDLTEATDRFPLSLQVEVIGRLFGNQLAEVWMEILTGFPFTHFSAGKRTEVLFRTGQPMGALSSFPAFALTHHVVVRALARKFRVPASYAILGDDIVIRGDTLGKAYMEFLGSIKVPYSPAKTFISNEVLEFAKRVIVRG